jgi:hypothetical protein
LAVTALRTPPRAVWASLVGPFGFAFSFVVASFFLFFFTATCSDILMN